MADKQAQVSAIMLEGSAAFKRGYLPQALMLFNRAVELDPRNEMIYNYRALTYIRINKFEEALEDAEKIIELKRSWVKGYVRKGVALMALKRFEEAMMALMDGLDKDPRDDTVKKAIMQCRKHIAGPMGGDKPLVSPFADFKLWEKIEKNPITRQYLNQPDYREMVQKLQKDPKELKNYMDDARIMTTVGVLLDVDIEAPVEASGGDGAQGEVHEVLPSAGYSGGLPKPSFSFSSVRQPGPVLSELDEIDDVVMPNTGLTITELPDDYEESQPSTGDQKKKRNRRNKSARKAAAAARAAAGGETGTAGSGADEPGTVEFGGEETGTVRVGENEPCAVGVGGDEKGTVKVEPMEGVEEQGVRPQETRQPEEKPKVETTEKLVDQLKNGQEKKALEEKNKGNVAYKQKQFDTALEHYSKAIELDPTNIVFKSNKAAVYFEQGDYDTCIKECEEAIEIGRENRADFKVIAKAMARIGNAYHKKGDLENSLRFYEKSVSEHRVPDLVKKVVEIKKELKEKERLAYIDPEKSLEAKKLGNEAFQKGDYPGAIKHYNEAINRNPDDCKLFSNRAACYTKLAEFNMAVKDAEECIRLDPNFVKGYLRRGGCLLAMKEYSKAKSAYQKAIELDKNCQEAIEGFRRCSMEENDPEAVQQRVMNDPEIRKILQDPGMQTILSQMQQDPSAVREHLKNPEIASRIQKLIDCGLIRMQSM